jgi:hypothetical protein
MKTWELKRLEEAIQLSLDDIGGVKGFEKPKDTFAVKNKMTGEKYEVNQEPHVALGNSFGSPASYSITSPERFKGYIIGADAVTPIQESIENEIGNVEGFEKPPRRPNIHEEEVFQYLTDLDYEEPLKSELAYAILEDSEDEEYGDLFDPDIIASTLEMGPRSVEEYKDYSYRTIRSLLTGSEFFESVETDFGDVSEFEKPDDYVWVKIIVPPDARYGDFYGSDAWAANNLTLPARRRTPATNLYITLINSPMFPSKYGGLKIPAEWCTEVPDPRKRTQESIEDDFNIEGFEEPEDHRHSLIDYIQDGAGASSDQVSSNDVLEYYFLEEDKSEKTEEAIKNTLQHFHISLLDFLTALEAEAANPSGNYFGYDHLDFIIDSLKSLYHPLQESEDFGDMDNCEKPADEFFL